MWLMSKKKRFRIYFAIVFLIISTTFIYSLGVGVENAAIGIYISLLSFLFVLYSAFEAELKQKEIKSIIRKLDEIKSILEKNNL